MACGAARRQDDEARAEPRFRDDANAAALSRSARTTRKPLRESLEVQPISGIDEATSDELGRADECDRGDIDSSARNERGSSTVLRGLPLARPNLGFGRSTPPLPRRPFPSPLGTVHPPGQQRPPRPHHQLPSTFRPA
ncbi:hypothetical protein SKAU_G00273080 [Synaphobranchus kaupii]|uniref:Uncharacterized protein n=1 Tax=Synaphobranchus kaupii TaxID=118154 RepID=A0A9Q1IQS6_SYNKA|nr:hypothetical protein SKAU_G00273080 [Synaphobranchus kaupii]